MKKVSIILLVTFLLACTAWLLLPKPPLMETIGFSQAVYDQNRQLLRLTLSPDDKYRLFVPLEHIAPNLVEATLLKEDRYFYRHWGVNPWSLLRAFGSTYVSGNRRLGGSTITMQLARIRYRIHSRGVLGKLRQMLKAIELERHYSKKEILEAYFNLAPYSRNIEGVGAASLIYFQKDAEDLNLPEALALTVIPQNPNARNPSHSTESLKSARMELFQSWLKIHPEDSDQKFFMELPLGASSPEKLPFRAPHFVDALLQNQKQGDIKTTLDLTLQSLVEKQLQAYVKQNRHLGMKNGAALLLDYQTMEIKAAVGSVDFFSEAIDGQVNGTRAKRSPGSALKPFVYALAMDQGKVHPLTLLKDTATSFGGYDPENFDHEFLGPISVRNALIKSRNIPAVYLASQLSAPDLYDFYVEAGIGGLKAKSFYGLTMALGGMEIDMEEMVSLYAMLANGGVLRNLIRVKGAGFTEERQLVSPEASYLVLDMLKGNPPPDNFEKIGGIPVSWKTGTSYSYRDAWSVGVVGPYVLCVWIGNFDGHGNPAFVGRTAAGPLFFKIIDDLKTSRVGTSLAAKGTDPKKLNLKKVEVCRLSGGMPGPSCPRRDVTWFVGGKSPIAPCEIHRSVAIDNKTGKRACSENQDDIRHEVYEFWPSDLAALFKNAGLPRQGPPDYQPGCDVSLKSGEGHAPQIVSPQKEVTYYIRTDDDKDNRIPLKVVADADTREVFWFADEQFIGQSPSNRTLFWSPQPGKYTVRVVDDNGRTNARSVLVSAVQ